METDAYRCVFVGDGACGKSTLIEALASSMPRRKLIDDPSALVVESALHLKKSKRLKSKGKSKSKKSDGTDTAAKQHLMPLQLVDTNGEAYALGGAAQAAEQVMRTAGRVSALVVMFSVISPASAQAVRDVWLPAVRALREAQARSHPVHRSSTPLPLVLVGTKCDLRTDPRLLSRLQARGLRPVTEREGQTLAREIGAVRYVEVALGGTAFLPATAHYHPAYQPHHEPVRAQAADQAHSTGTSLAQLQELVGACIAAVLSGASAKSQTRSRRLRSPLAALRGDRSKRTAAVTSHASDLTSLDEPFEQCVLL
eukprot:CAMPEP_0174235180 /NCGR_PEP_ID=MMETSP0417-20130205/4710_1 /TAXON_ID=242541 /ORGANISM="Mayorella sp, Strain BSH-02190019" /LENGTH=311 /DNA_ID=CAMNT_0015313653 /DNA_START=70 /DNA_END=1005 /DNA_ORIENTATION=+